MEKRGKNLNLENIFIGITILLGVIVIINIVLTYNLNKEFKKGTEAVQERLKPAKIELVIIKNSKCTDCFDISTIVSHVKNANIEVTKELMFEFDSKEGKEIISKNKIEKIPTVVLTGEIDKTNIEGLEKKENALVLTRLDPPFTNANTGDIEGKVTLYYLKDSKCEKCKNLSFLISQIKAAGVKIYKENVIEPNSADGKEVIGKYKIDFASTIILSKDASAYEIIQQAWPQIGTKEADGSYVMRLVSPPFVNLTTGKLRGIVDITYLTDKSCTECYDVNQHNEILASEQGFAIKFGKEEKYDISDEKGKGLIAKYNITKVPTVILFDEINAYPSSQALRQFFSVERDGSYIFRLAEAIGTYKDITTNQIIQPQAQGQ